VPWVIVGGFGVFLGVIWFLGLRALQSRVRVESVSAGGAAVKLSAKENSYFDEYLDEIVYFFQKTKTQVAIFEDLDRFRDPHIFETLRELNTVLNNSEQIKSRPVRFVYAVRDSIFEQLKVDAARTATRTPIPMRQRFVRQLWSPPRRRTGLSSSTWSSRWFRSSRTVRRGTCWRRSSPNRMSDLRLR
jgi:hypothetical protein